MEWQIRFAFLRRYHFIRSAFVNCNFDRNWILRRAVHCNIDYRGVSEYDSQQFQLPTLPIHIGSNVKASDVNRWRRLNPDTLPDAATGCVEYMRRAQSLLSDWNHVVATIGGVMNEDKAVRYKLILSHQEDDTYSWFS